MFWKTTVEKALAKQLLDAAVELDHALGKIDMIISTIPNEEERRIFAKNLGNIIGQINDSFIRPVARQYPELDPD